MITYNKEFLNLINGISRESNFASRIQSYNAMDLKVYSYRKRLNSIKIQKGHYCTQNTNVSTIKIIYLLENLIDIDSVLENISTFIYPKIFDILNTQFSNDNMSFITKDVHINIKFLFYNKKKSSVVEVPTEFYKNLEYDINEVIQILDPLKNALRTLNFLKKVCKKKYKFKDMEKSLLTFINRFQNSIFINEKKSVLNTHITGFIPNFKTCFDDKIAQIYNDTSELKVTLKLCELWDFKRNLESISLFDLQKDDYITCNTTFDNLIIIQRKEANKIQRLNKKQKKEQINRNENL